MALTQIDISSAAARLIADGYSLHLVSNRAVLDHLDTAPFDLPVTAVDFLATGDDGWDVSAFLRVYNKLNGLAFGPDGIPLDMWVMIDLGLLPSAFMLVTLPRERVLAVLDDESFAPAQRTAMRQVIPPLLAEAQRLGFDGPIPVAGYCAAPTPAPGTWIGWSLCSVIPGLATTAKGLALQAYRADTLTGVTRYANPALRIHRKFGRTQIVSAALDLHPVPHTLVYRTDVYVEDDREPTFWLAGDDLDRQLDMQAKIQAGTHEFHIQAPGLLDGNVPVLETVL